MRLSRTISINDTKIELTGFYGCPKAKEWYAYIHASDISKPFHEQLSDIKKSIQQLVSDYMEGAVCVAAKCHVSDAANQKTAINEALKDSVDGMFTIVQQPPLDGSKLTVGIYAISNPEYISFNGNTAETVHNSYRHIFTSDMGKSGNSTYCQTTGLLDDYCRNAADKSMTLKDNCVRTWLYVNDIDNNYADVVRARNDIFDREGLTINTHYIASTGISGFSGRKGTNIILDTYSIKGLQPGQTKYLYAATHLNRTSEYGVRFERGVAISYGDRTHAFISGTASIDNKGEIMFPGDVGKQTERMLQNISQLLKETDMTLEDNTMQITVYLRDMADYTTTKKLFDKRFPDTPKVILLAPVCRPGWLIEMECICIKDSVNDFPPF